MEVSVDEQIGRRIRRRRLILGLTQAQLGARAGVRFQQIQKYECAANKVSAGTLWRLSVALGVLPSYFFEALAKRTHTRSVRIETMPAHGAASADLDNLTELVTRLKPRVQRRLLALAQSLEEREASASRTSPLL
jgi:transcriptional regulator with XRE-family HTH domain